MSFTGPMGVSNQPDACILKPELNNVNRNIDKMNGDLDSLLRGGTGMRTATGSRTRSRFRAEAAILGQGRNNP